jgi:DNA repair photolyase
MRLEYQEYEARKIVNVRKHVDGWFWDKYSAHPYIGCRSGCLFCYERGSYYLKKEHLRNFDTQIRVKINAVELLHKELASLEPDVISCGDWQEPAESCYGLSRDMLKVVQEYGFPVFIVERSPTLTRDLDLLVAINKGSWVGVAISISSTEAVLKRAFEPHSPGVRRRLAAMERLALEGILVGTALMPVLPYVGDSDSHLEDVISATRNRGGKFVLAGGLTMSGLQAELSMKAVKSINNSMEEKWYALYKWGKRGNREYSLPRSYSARIGRKVRDLCAKYGLDDRLSRYIPPGNLGINKRIAERLHRKAYDLELEEAQMFRIWAYRRAAWTVDELPESIATIYSQKSKKGLVKLPNIGTRIASQIAEWIREEAKNEQY